MTLNSRRESGADNPLNGSENEERRLVYTNRIPVNSPQVSICMSLYKAEKTVVRALKAVFQQTDKNFELVISDDCSPDDTVNVAKAWLEKNDTGAFPVRFYSSTKNQGITGNRLRGLSYASGVWNLFADGDDFLVEEAVDRLKAIISRLDPVPSVIKVSAFEFNAETLERIPTDEVEDCYYPPGDPIDGQMAMGSSGHCISRELYELFQEVELICPIIADDAVFGRRALLHKGIWRVAEKLYNCGISPRSASGGGVSGKKWIVDRINRWDQLLKDIESINGAVPKDWRSRIFQYRRNMVLDARLIDCSVLIWPFLWIKMLVYSRSEAMAALKKRIKLCVFGDVNGKVKET